MSLEVSPGVCGGQDVSSGVSGVRVRRSKRGLSQKVSLEVSPGVCVVVRFRRSKRGLSHKVSLEVSSGVCGGQGSQVQDGAVTEGVGVRVCRSKRGLSRVSLEVLPSVWVTVLRIGFLNCMVGWGGSGRCIKSTTNSTKSTKREESDRFSPVSNQTKTKMKDEKDGKDTWEGQVNWR